MGENPSKGYPDFRLPEAETAWVGQEEGLRGEEEWASQEGRDHLYCATILVPPRGTGLLVLFETPDGSEVYVPAIAASPDSMPVATTYTVLLCSKVTGEIRTLFAIFDDKEVVVDIPVPIKVPPRHELVVEACNRDPVYVVYSVCALGWWVGRPPLPPPTAV